MYENKFKKVIKYEASIEKKKNIIIQKKKSLEETVLKKLKILFKKFNTDVLKLEFEEVKDSNNYMYHRNNTPDLIIHYDQYSIKLNNDGEIGSISDWYGFGNENRDTWHEYLTLIGHFANAMQNKKPIYNFLTKRFKKLGELHTDLEETINEYNSYKKETDSLVRSKKKNIISNIVKDGDSYHFGKGGYCHVNGYNYCTKIDILGIKNKTYMCSIYSERAVMYGKGFGWFDIYIKHDDLHNILLNKMEYLGTDFKRRFNLEITLTK